MLIKLNDGESITVVCNHVPGVLREGQAITINNHGKQLGYRLFNNPAELEDKPDTCKQQTKVRICHVCKGTGSVVDNSGFGPAADCLICDGTGKL